MAVVFKFAQLVAVYTAKTYSYKTHFTLSALSFILFLYLINFLKKNRSKQPGAKPLCQAHYHNAEIFGLADGSDYSRQSRSRETHSPTFYPLYLNTSTQLHVHAQSAHMHACTRPTKVAYFRLISISFNPSLGISVLYRALFSFLSGEFLFR